MRLLFPVSGVSAGGYAVKEHSAQSDVTAADGWQREERALPVFT